MEKKNSIKIARGENIYQADRDIIVVNGNVTIFNEPEIDFVFTRNNDTSIEYYFAGREQERDFIVKEIKNTQKSKFLLTGIGGIGKTHLSRYIFNYYLNSHKSNQSCDIDFIGYLTYHGSFDQTIVDGINYEKNDDYNDNLIKAWNILEELSKKKTLLIIDNIDKYFHEDTSLNKLHQLPCNIIITSRFNSFRNFKPIEITPLPIEICKNIFKSVYPEIKESPNIDMLDQILDLRAAKHTYTIELLAKISRSNDWDLDELESNLNKFKFKLEYNENGIINSLEKEYKKLFKISNLSYAEINILEAFSLLPYLPLESKYCYELIKDDAKINDNHTILNSLYEKGWLIKKNTSYLMHPIISDTLKQIRKITIKGHNNIIKKSIHLSNIDNLDYRTTFTQAQQLLPFFESIGNNLYYKNLDIAFLFKSIGMIYYNAKNYSSAIHSYYISKKIFRMKFGNKHELSLELFSNIAHSYEKIGKLNRAKNIFEIIIPYMENNSNILVSDFNVMINNLCGVYNKLNPNLMYNYLVKAIHNWKKININNFDTATSYSLMAVYFYNKKQFKNAIKNEKKAIKIGLKIDSDHIRISTYYIDLATYYSELGNQAKALKYYKKAQNILKSYNQEHSYHGLILLYNIGYTFMILEDYKKANKYYIEAAYWQFKTFGKHHYFSKALEKYIKINYEYLLKTEQLSKSNYNDWLIDQFVDYQNSLSDDIIALSKRQTNTNN